MNNIFFRNTLIFVIFISVNAIAQEKIILTTGDTVVGSLSKVDYDHSRITKPDGSTLLILTSMIKKEVPETEDSLIPEDKETLIIGLHGAPAGAVLVGGENWKSGFQPVMGFIAGASFRYKLKPRFAICAELNYERKGNTSIYHNISGSDLIDSYSVTPQAKYYGSIKLKQIADYITLPLIAQFKVNKKKIAIHVNVGVYMSYFLRTRYQAALLGEAFGEPSEWLTPYSRKISMGLLTGFGVNIPVKKQYSFLIELRNNIQLGKIFRTPQQESFALLFGVSYKLKQ